MMVGIYRVILENICIKVRFITSEILLFVITIFYWSSLSKNNDYNLYHAFYNLINEIINYSLALIALTVVIAVLIKIFETRTVCAHCTTDPISFYKILMISDKPGQVTRIAVAIKRILNETKSITNFQGLLLFKADSHSLEHRFVRNIRASPD